MSVREKKELTSAVSIVPITHQLQQIVLPKKEDEENNNKKEGVREKEKEELN